MYESTLRSEAARPQLPVRTGPIGARTTTQRLEADPPGRPYRTERRNLSSRQALLRRITVEYQEMPGLRLTAAQARRLFGLRDDVCTRVLHYLVDADFLRRDVNGSYGRASCGW